MTAPPRAPAVAVLGIVVIASALTWTWELSRQPHPSVGASDVWPGMRDAARAMPDLAQQVLGVFGAVLDVPLPIPVYAGWALLTFGVVGLAARFGGRRERVTLVGLALASLASIVVLAIAVMSTGFPVQTRHVLPVVLLLPLVAGEVLARHADDLPPAFARHALLAAVSVAAAVHLAAWYANAQAWSGRSGARLPALGRAVVTSSVLDPLGGCAPPRCCGIRRGSLEGCRLSGTRRLRVSRALRIAGTLAPCASRPGVCRRTLTTSLDHRN